MPITRAKRSSRNPTAGNPLQVTVVHGNLAYIDEPLFIGHYASMALSGAEAVVDAQIGGTMSKALAMQAGHYPEALGTHLAFDNLRRDPHRPEALPKPAAVMVVGLGAEGVLTERALADTVCPAVLDWLQRHHERQAPRGQRVPARIAATLIGSGGIGVSPGASARALVEAVLEANRHIQSTGWQPVGELRLIELYLDRAAEAWRELQLLAVGARDAGSAFTLAATIGTGSGGKRRPLDTSYRGADYDLVRLSGRGQDTIEFAMDSRRARSEVRTHSTQRTLVQGLVRHAAQHRQADRRLGNTLFKLLVPPDIEPYLTGQTRLILDMAPSVAALPWELLDSRVPPPGDAHHLPWSVRTGLLRKMQVASERPAGLRDSLADDQALVVGDPKLPDDLARWQLPHAHQEASEVSDALRRARGFGPSRVVPLVQADTQAITNTLFERDWRVIHIAGHGQWDGQAGGVMLSEPGAWLGPREVRAMRAAPELVFLNCCHLADLRDADPAQAARLQQFEPGDLAQGMAAELIRAGVRCVVAAGWAVDDDAARCFARQFYARLAEGGRFGDAVTEARRATWVMEHQRHWAQGGQPDAPKGNTWAAYQCYGDPDWRLVRPTTMDDARGDQGSPDRPLPAGAPEERLPPFSNAPALAWALESLAIDARWGGVPPVQVREDTAWLAARYADPMGHIGAIAEAFGLAFDEAGDPAEAIRWYERAIHARDGSASLKALEALGNLRLRWAHEQARDGGPAVAARVLPEAEKGLAALQLHARTRDTDEAHCLVGSAHKRIAMIQQVLGAPPDEVVRSLEAMRQAYEQALARADATGGNRMYPLNNLAALALRQTLGQESPRQQQARAMLPALLDTLAVELARYTGQHHADEWGRLGVIELALKQALLAVDATAWQQGLADLDDLYLRVPGPKMWRTVKDQWDFVLSEVDTVARQAMKAALTARLATFAAGA